MLWNESKLDKNMLDLIQQSVNKISNFSNAMYYPNCEYKVNEADKFCLGFRENIYKL